MDSAFAQHFATEWMAAWNSHDLDRVLSHYSNYFEMSSPYIVASRAFAHYDIRAVS
jgi:hypothetical protein